jgi:hypothetical protein
MTYLRGYTLSRGKKGLKAQEVKAAGKRYQKMPCRTKKSSTCLHLLMHIFMVHGVDPLVEEAVNTPYGSLQYSFQALKSPFILLQSSLNPINNEQEPSQNPASKDE